MSSRTKGRKHELKCKEQLEKGGWLCHITDMPQKFKKSMDIWGIFDLIAIKQGEIRLIQVTSNTTGGKLKELKAFNEKYVHGRHPVELWVWVDRKGWKIYYIGGGKQWKK